MRTFASLLVVGPVLVPRLAGGEVDWDEITRRAVLPAGSGADGEAPRVERMQVPWGPAVRVSWTRRRNAASYATAKHARGYWVLAEPLGSLIVIHGDVSAATTDESCRLLSDIDAIAVSMTVLPG